jgi:hypothetical protein
LNSIIQGASEFSIRYLKEEREKNLYGKLGEGVENCIYLISPTI